MEVATLILSIVSVVFLFFLLFLNFLSIMLTYVPELMDKVLAEQASNMVAELSDKDEVDCNDNKEE
ncbi:MAG: hypothetical protein E7353_06765 [Clostridiales bacterium]|nr:hypothetical protein [Clostridiales bacterium]